MVDFRRPAKAEVRKSYDARLTQSVTDFLPARIAPTYDRRWSGKLRGDLQLRNRVNNAQTLSAFSVCMSVLLSVDPSIFPPILPSFLLVCPV